MQSEIYKCCFCLQTVVHPVVMCYQSHVGCFDCVCEQLRKNPQDSCAICRQRVTFRFDRLITETSKCFRRTKRRKKESEEYTVFMKLLQLKQKEHVRPFTKTLKRFAHATANDQIEQISEDIDNILKARESCKRLLDYKLYDHRLERHITSQHI